MKAIAQIVAMLSYAALAITQWFAEVDGLHEVLGWPSFVCWLVSFFTAPIPLLGTAAGIWGAHTAWGWSWLPTLVLFLGWPLLVVAIVVVAATVDSMRSRRRGSLPPSTRL